MFKTTFFSVVITFFSLSGSLIRGETEYPNMPTAVVNKATSMEKSILIRAAAIKACELWGDVRAGEPIPCTDFEGNLNYYLIPFSFGKDFPSYDNLFQQRQAVKDRAKRLLDEFEPQYDETFYKTENNTAVGDMNNDVLPFPVERPDGTLSHRILYHQSLEVLKGNLSESQFDTNFGTVVMAVSQEVYPIPAIYHFLPPLFISGTEARQLAEEKLQTSNCLLKNIIFLGPGALYYRFTNNSEDILINCKTLQIIEDIDEFKNAVSGNEADKAVEITRAELDEINEDVKKAWAELLTAIK